MRRLLLSLCVVPIVSGCTSFALGENDPDTNLGTYLTGGDIAVDPKTETLRPTARRSSPTTTRACS
jgi:hypothetical protein